MTAPILHSLFSALLVLSSCDRDDVKRGIPIWHDGSELIASRQPTRVFVTPDLRDVVFLVESPDSSSGKLSVVKVALNNGIIPTFRMDVSHTGSTFRYDYKITNSITARDSIFEVIMVVAPFLPNTDVSFHADPPGTPTWGGVPNLKVLDEPSEMGLHVPGRLVLWLPHGEVDQVDSGKMNIMPGQTKGIFRITSLLMPGFTTGKTSGMPYAPTEDVIDSVGAQLAPLEDYFETTTLTFGPIFLPGAPASEVLANYRNGITRLIGCRGIPHTPTFLSEVAALLEEKGIESQLSERLNQLRAKPGTPIEAEMLACLRLVADSFAKRSR